MFQTVTGFTLRAVFPRTRIRGSLTRSSSSVTASIVRNGPGGDGRNGALGTSNISGSAAFLFCWRVAGSTSFSRPSLRSPTFAVDQFSASDTAWGVTGEGGGAGIPVWGSGGGFLKSGGGNSLRGQ